MADGNLFASASSSHRLIMGAYRVLREPIEMRSEGFAVSVSQGVPEPVRELFWLVFFASKGRGISLDTHFPWLEDELNVFCLTISDAYLGATGRPLAALLIRKVAVSKEKNIGLVGLVCVAEEWRGKGLSKKLLSKAINLGKEISLSVLVLWTQKPDVYAGLGFQIDERYVFNCVSKKKSNYPVEKYSSSSWPDKSAIEKKQGLAPFATSGEIIKSKKASLVVFHSSQISTLVDWAGDNDSLVRLLHCALPDRWAMSSYLDDKLISSLKGNGFFIEPQSSSVRMIKVIDALKGEKIPQIKNLDRI